MAVGMTLGTQEGGMVDGTEVGMIRGIIVLLAIGDIMAVLIGDSIGVGVDSMLVIGDLLIGELPIGLAIGDRVFIITTITMYLLIDRIMLGQEHLSDAVLREVSVVYALLQWEHEL